MRENQRSESTTICRDWCCCYTANITETLEKLNEKNITFINNRPNVPNVNTFVNCQTVRELKPLVLFIIIIIHHFI